MKNSLPSEMSHETPEEIVEHISRLMNEAEALLVGPVATQAGERGSELRSRLAALQSRAAEFYSGAKKKVTAGARVADDTIRSHPYESIAVALGVGLLCGALWRRNSA